MVKAVMFGQRLQALRLAAGLSQSQLAAATGLPIGSLKNYEQDRREPQWSVVIILAKALGVSTDEAFADIALQPRPPVPKGKAKAAARGKARKGKPPPA
jgi:transcriptional regulator with XRE-family HTH domain